MPVSVDLATENVRTGTTSPQTFSHAGASSGVKGVVLAIVHGVSSTDHVSAASYGGVAMTRAQRNVDTATEPGAAELWFLGASVPQGTQTVSYTPGSTTDDIHAVAITLLGADDLEVVAQNGISENVANPSVTLAYGGRTCMAFAALYGGGAAPSSFAENANCTRVHDHDLGAFYSVVCRQTTAGSSDFAIGGTASSDDVAFAAIAVSEVANDPISGTADQVFSNSATLTGKGALAGVADLAFANTATLTLAASPIEGMAAQAFSNTATLTGDGALAGDVAIALSNTATIAGDGALAGVAAQAFANTADLNGKGALAGTAGQSFTNTATVTGKGSLAGSADQVFTNTATLTALSEGDIAGVAAQSFANTGTLTGHGALSGVAQIAFSDSGTLLGFASISGTADVAFSNSGTLSGRGSLAGLVAITFITIGDLDEAGESTPGISSATDMVTGITPADIALTNATRSDAAATITTRDE